MGQISKSVFVTGATGFIGKYLVRSLILEGWSVSILVRDEKIAKQEFGDSCKIVVGDTTQPATLVDIFNDIDIVYHLAALMGHDLPSGEAFLRFRAINLQGTINVVNECKLAGIKKFIYISSTAAMGLLNISVVNENTECVPYTPYQVSKYESEQFVINEFRKNGFPVIVLRPSMVYGPGFKGDFLTIAKLCKTGFFPKIGKGENLSPALYITDLVNALLLFATLGKEGEVYLLSSEQSYSLDETVKIIGETLHEKIRFIYVPVRLALLGVGLLELIYKIRKKHPPVTQRNICSMVTDRIFDISKAKQIGFKQSIPLNVGLANTINYFIDNKYL